MGAGTRITADLGNPKWLKLLKLEASQRGVKMRDVLISALETYFADAVETRSLLKAAETTFEEWDNPQDRAYDDV